MTQTSRGTAGRLSALEVRRLVDERVVRITWNDTHVSAYPFAYLRGWCPCAACQGHGNEPRYIHADNTDLVKISPVGTYALSFVWGDGHDTGIYSYRWLRQLCACSTCRAEA